MKFRCGESYRGKNARLISWHKWYAWHPIVIHSNDKIHQCWHWLETIERKRKSGYVGYYWEYREILNGRKYI